TALLLQIDAAIKCMTNENAQHLMQQNIAGLGGKTLFIH
ncbi:DNA polymerase III subunit delta, partial [Acinetobacter baumannii]